MSASGNSGCVYGFIGMAVVAALLLLVILDLEIQDLEQRVTKLEQRQP